MILIIRRRIAELIADRSGQDMLEYALLGGFMASCALAIFPAIASVDGCFSKVIVILSSVSQTAGVSQ